MIHSHRRTTLLILGGFFILSCTCLSGIIPEATPAPEEPVAVQPEEEPPLDPTPPPYWDRVYVEYILDMSGSMNAEEEGGRTRREIALDVLADRARVLPSSTNVGLRVYGHRLPYTDDQSCQDIELLVPVARGGRDRILDELPALEAQGMTPMTDSIVQAADDFGWDDPLRRNSIILISDGEETCGEDPCDAVQVLQELGIDFTIHVVGYGIRDNQVARQQLQCVADLTGGTFHLADSEQELRDALDQIWDDVEQNASQEEPTPEPPPDLGEGDVTIRLYWYETCDMDLYVTDPDGDVVYFGNRNVPSGGELDHDANFPCSTGSTNPVENVYWPTGGAPMGDYSVEAHYYGECNREGDTEFRLWIEVDGAVITDERHTISPGESFYYDFTR